MTRQQAERASKRKGGDKRNKENIHTAQRPLSPYPSFSFRLSLYPSAPSPFLSSHLILNLCLPLSLSLSLSLHGSFEATAALRTLRPLDTATVINSVERTNRAIIIEESWKTGGFGAELASTVQEQAFDSLDGPVGRIGGAEVPAPYNGALEAATLPDAARIAKAVETTYGI